MEAKAIPFRFEFGLDSLPLDPGFIVVRGPRQFGKSTWLELELRGTIEDFGRGTAFYLNGDELVSVEDLVEKLRELHPAYPKDASVKRLFIDEITAIPFWEKGIKRVLDEGLFRDVLIVTTGSKATDLRRGSERLPGRKGRLPKSEYVFLPISYQQFHENCSQKLGDKTWIAYLLSGGSPIACNDIYQLGRLPEYFIQLTRDWVLGEIVASGRSRISLANILQYLFRWGGTPVGYAKLAREAGLANNTVAAGYVEQLGDLLCLFPSWPWDPNRRILQPRKPCKFHFIHLAMVVSFYPASLRAVHEFETLNFEEQGIFIEWLVAQEIWRRAILHNEENPEAIGFWASHEHEIDFVTPARRFIEVKRGRASGLDFGWFSKVFPKEELTVICQESFTSRQILGVTIEEFLLNEEIY
jgi:predicted AAA+ superfamily ATPase